MKICLISFDYWGFDRNIVDALRRRGIETTHIDMNHFKYSYPSIFAKVANGFSKAFFNENIKRSKKQKYVLNKLEQIGHQDIILTIRPDLLDRKTHEIIKSKTKKYIAYLYDSTRRFPVKHLQKNIFDEIFSFDREDSAVNNFKKITNYIYLPKQKLNAEKKHKHSVFIVISNDERLRILNAVSKKLDDLNVDYKFVVKSNKSLGNVNPKILRTKKDVNLDELRSLIEDSKVMMDISRSTNTGLSFRVFESLAYQKKLITTNQAVKNYDFYDANNILVIDPKSPEIPRLFFDTPYHPINHEIYQKYTIDTWVKTVFGLE